MTTRRTPALVAALVALVVAVGAAAAVRQGDDAWRASALQSFDDAWQTVNDSFYDPGFNGVDWAAVRTELRPKVEAAASPEAVRQIIRDMIGRLGTSHFQLLTTSPDSETLPGDARVLIEARATADGVIVTQVDAGSSADRAGIKPGDRVFTIDDVDVSAAPAGGSDARAQELDIWKRAFRALHGANGSAAHLTIAHVGAADRVNVVATRAIEGGDLVSLGNLPPLHVRTSTSELKTPAGHRVGIVAFNVWMVAVAEPFAAAVDRYRSDDGFIIDLRGNTGGLAEMIRGIAGHFLATPDVLGRMHLRGADLEFRANPRLSTSAGRRVQPFAGPVAVLVDGLTASASECFAGGLQSLGRVRVFGEQTMGEALPASTRQLPDGDVLLYAVGDFVTSTGQRLEGPGVIPDQAVPLDRAALAAGRDPVVLAALAWVDQARAGQGRGF